MANSKNSNSKKTNTRRSTSRKKLEQTTRIRIDNERLNDFDSLDTSFLEGRVEQKAKKDKKYKKKLLNSSTKKSVDLTIIKNIISFIVLLLVIIGIVFILFNKTSTSSKKVKKEKEPEQKIVMDKNYLFVGDFHTDKLDFSNLDYHYVKISDSNYKTTDLLEHITEDIYKYNPSIIFIQIGFNDLNEGINEADIATTINEIVDGIKENRKYAKIYLESVYPIGETDEEKNESLNDNIDNDKISSLNKLLKELSNDKKIEYLNIYDKLLERGKLSSEYSLDGIYLNEEGYRKVFAVLEQAIEKENAKEY